MDKLALFCMMYRVDLVEIEGFVADLEAEGASAGGELRERLNKARAAVSPLSNEHEAKRHIEWIMNRMREIHSSEAGAPHRKRGIKVLNGAKAGHEHVHGTEAEKKKRWAGYQEFIDQKHAEQRFLSYEECAKLAAEEFKVGLKTIKRHTSNWKPCPRNK